MYPQTQKKIAEMLKVNIFPGVSYTFIDMDKTEMYAHVCINEPAFIDIWNR